MKKIVRIRILALVCLLASVGSAWAQSVKIDSLYYTLGGDTAIVASSDEYTAYKSVNIPAKVTYGGKDYAVTSIESFAFMACGDITSVTLPSGITIIGEYAFKDCTSLTSINIPSGVTSIEGYTFSDCTSLTSINIPSGVTSIKGYAFYDCQNLTSILLPNGLKSIGDQAFRFCTSLTSFAIPDSVTSLGSAVLGGCKSIDTLYLNMSKVGAMDDYFSGTATMKHVVLGNGVTGIADYAFNNCSSLISINIPSGMTSIGTGVFKNCSGLTSINFPSGLTSIGANAFYNCRGLTSINIPATVTSIEDDAFQLCSSIDTLYWNKPTVEPLADIFPSYATMKCVVLGEEVTNIEASAFYNCSSLISINIPATVTSIGSNAFWGCTLDTIYWNKPTVDQFHTTFSNYDKIKCVVLGNSVKSIGEYAFRYCKALTSITILDSVTSIGKYAFSDCSSLSSIDIPSSVTSIGDGVFSDCSSLSSIDIPSSVTSLGSSAFDGTAWYNNQPDGLIYVGNVAYEYKGTASAAITLREGTVSIASGAFQACSSLPSITLPNSVTSIGSFAFLGCSSLSSINIPSSVTSIGDYAFEGCSSLTSAYVLSTIPPNMSSVAFDSSVPTTCTLYVKDGDNQSIARYQAATGWKNFTTIKKCYPVTIISAGAASVFLPYAAKIPAGVKVYTGVAGNNSVEMTEITDGIVPANTGVVVMGKDSTYLFEESDAAGTATSDLKGVTAEMVTPANTYVLSDEGGKVGFYHYVGEKIQPNRVYITSTSGAQVLGLVFGGIATDIHSVTAPQSIESQPVYDLQGRRVEKMQKGGLYIVNGKKTIYQ